MYSVLRLLRAQTLTVDFNKPWIYLAETSVAVRSTADFSAQSERWWWVLDKARTFFEDNLDV